MIILHKNEILTINFNKNFEIEKINVNYDIHCINAKKEYLYIITKNMDLIILKNMKIITNKIQITHKYNPIVQINDHQLSLSYYQIKDQINILLLCVKKYNIPKYLKMKILNDLCDMQFEN
jgi:hypothetical protein